MLMDSAWAMGIIFGASAARARLTQGVQATCLDADDAGCAPRRFTAATLFIVYDVVTTLGEAKRELSLIGVAVAARIANEPTCLG